MFEMVMVPGKTSVTMPQKSRDRRTASHLNLIHRLFLFARIRFRVLGVGG